MALTRLEAVSTGGLELLVDRAARSRGLLVAFTNRHGGASDPPWDSLNLAARVGDDVNAVAENRARVGRALRFDPARLVFARQVHGVDLLEIDPGDAGVVGEGDGLVTTRTGPMLCVLTADCAPVVVEGERRVAVLHAGWRGLVAGVVAAGVARVAPARAAWIGPSIRSCCYEVGEEVQDAFEEKGLPVAGRRRVDIAAVAAAALRAAGVDDVAMVPSCTHCDPAFYSYRRDRVTGRQGALSGLLR